jgi:membrane protein
MGLGELCRRFDRYQQRHAWLGFPLAVRQKYSDDQGGYLAATIAYYGFFSIFPLLLVFVSALGFVLQGHPHLQQTILHSALSQLPLVGKQSIRALSGNGLALGLGIAGALWAGMGVFLAAENAMNHLWGVPFKRRPDFFRARGRALALLLVLGGGVLVTTGLGGLGTFGAHYGIAWKLGSIALSTLLNIGLFWVGFRVLTTTKDVSWGCLRGGAIAAGILYELLQTLGGYYLGHVLKNASNVYGTFGLVIGLLSWIYLAAHVTLLAAEANVVATRRLWPRSFSVIFEQPATEADERALRQRTGVEERRQDQHVQVDFRPAAGDQAVSRDDEPAGTRK